jgi:hypothetical protein
MDKRALIAISVAIGLVAGGFAGCGAFYLLNPEVSHRSYTLTILNYKGSTYTDTLTWAPSNVGSNYTDNLLKNCTTIIFEENTNVTIVAGPSAYFDTWTTRLGSAAVHWVSNKLGWILMDSNKILEILWD